MIHILKIVYFLIFLTPIFCEIQEKIMNLKTEQEVIKNDFRRGNLHRKECSLIFTADCHTEEGNDILDILKEKGVKCSFFLTGKCIDTYAKPELIKRIINDGHEIGSHLYHHDPWEDIVEIVPDEYVRGELWLSNYALKKLTGVEMVKVWIAPYEISCEKNRNAAAKDGWIHINFTEGFNTNDWATRDYPQIFNPPEKIVEKILNSADNSPYGLNGVIILLHLGTLRKPEDKMTAKIPSQNNTYLGFLIDEIHKRGYKIVKITELIKNKYK